MKLSSKSPLSRKFTDIQTRLFLLRIQKLTLPQSTGSSRYGDRKLYSTLNVAHKSLAPSRRETHICWYTPGKSVNSVRDHWREILHPFMLHQNLQPGLWMSSGNITMNMTRHVRCTKRSEPHSGSRFHNDPDYCLRAERAARQFQELRRKVQNIYMTWGATNHTVSQPNSMPYQTLRSSLSRSR